MTVTEKKLTREDLKIDGPVKWCTGCGGYPILTAIQKALPEVGVKHENIVFVSGIGCSSRFPYYINTYGFHSMHGRAMAIATGIKSANPGLHVWIATGDGDSMAIGGNHFIHMIRRNIDINCVIFNNRIYGLTKGQFSPTTPIGSKTKTSPEGTIESPFEPGELTMGAQGSFFARVIDSEPKGMTEVFIEAGKHKGTSIIEVFQNCLIFNDATHKVITGKDVRDDRIIYLKHGEPMIFGKESNKGIVLEGQELKAITIGENGYSMDDILIHDATIKNPNIHYMLARMNYPDLPVAVGVIRAVEKPTYDGLMQEQIDFATTHTNIKNTKDLLNSGKVFNIE